jgi:hypothetical protein
MHLRTSKRTSGCTRAQSEYPHARRRRREPRLPGPGPLVAQALLLAVFVAQALVVAFAAPLYARLYRHTQAAAFDERDSVPITPPPGDEPATTPEP